ncbi:VanZ family protein [Pelotomaculum propionicicum]|uniref:VanZ family protein n=1 Tax=Pelotomaculum propionicicum TaxID=258475 RepID=UPI003B7C3CEF
MANKNNKPFLLLSWVAVAFWLTIIFVFSSQPATQSDRLSIRVTEVIIQKVCQVIQLNIESSAIADLAKELNHMVRKFAHASAYFILGILMVNALRRSGLSGIRMVIIALSICTLYAVSDEIHQLFVPGRSAQIGDVFIDSAGAILGLGLYGAVGKISRVTTNR